MEMIKASILIPVRDDIEGLDITLSSLTEAGIMFRHDLEVIVCNDGGGGAVSDVIEKFGCREVRLESGMGSYAARNAGLKLASGRVIAFLDADQRVDPSWIADGIRALADADYVGGRIVVESPSMPGVWERFASTFAFPVEACLRRGHVAPTANSFIRREVIDQVGNFIDELFSGGDQEFGVRVYRAGLVQKYCASAITYHPTRNRHEQLRKLHRTGSGVAEVRLKVWKHSPLAVLVSSGFGMVKVIPEALWRLVSDTIICRNKKGPDLIAFMLISKLRKAIFLYYLFCRTARYYFAKT